MITAYKDIESTLEITAVFTLLGVDTAPDTSIKINIYPNNSDTQTITDTDMTQKDSITGFYKYAWDISGVTAGRYTYKITAVHDSKTYSFSDDIRIMTSSTDTIKTNVDDVETKIDVIDTNVDQIETASAYLDQYVSKAGMGNGGIEKTILIQNTSLVPVPGASVILYSDSAMTTAVTGEQISNSEGEVTFSMSVGTYYLRALAQGQTFNNPTELVWTA